jgi:hypothetical protein
MSGAMRRLGPIVVALALLVVAAPAGAAHPLQVVNGSAHGSGERVVVSFVVRNTSAARSVPTRATVILHSGRRRPPLRRPWIGALAPGERRQVAFTATLPHLLAAGTWAIRACIARRCIGLGSTIVGQGDTDEPTLGAKSSPGAKTPPGAQSPPAAQPISTIPADPLHPAVERPFRHVGSGVEYWGYVPGSYDASNLAPTPLLIWLHGCYGEAEGEAWVVDPGEEMQPPQDWLTLALAGREGGTEGACWVPSVDEAKVMAALADFDTHFNVDPRRVILGGYSSGGDLAYRTGFRHSATFAGLLIENSSPFRDTESTQAESLAAATTKLHIVHLAHLQDTTYPIEGVRAETNAVKAAGFPLERIEVRGEHWNDAGDVVKGQAVPGTDADLRTLLLPHIDDGWLAPAP